MTPTVWLAPPRSLALALVLGAASLAAQAACPTWPTAQRFVLNGSEVTDTRTGLVWARCSVGQNWSGTTCTGEITMMTNEAALTYAKAQSGWRLPNVKELSSLADRGCPKPAIDTTAFPMPNVSPLPFRTSSPNISNATHWIVFFETGRVGSSGSYSDGSDPVYMVRLVRTSQ